MPSQKSMEKAREITGGCSCHADFTSRGRRDPGCQFHLHAEDFAQALDDRTEECAKIAATHRLAWREKSNLTEASRERRDYGSMSIAAAHVESSIRSLSKGSSHEG